MDAVEEPEGSLHPCSFQSRSFSGGAAKRMKRRPCRPVRSISDEARRRSASISTSSSTSDVDQLAALAHVPFSSTSSGISSRAWGTRRSACRPSPGRGGVRTARFRASPCREILVEETGVDEVHAGVLHPPRTGPRERTGASSPGRAARVVLRVDVPEEVPGGLDEGVERVVSRGRASRRRGTARGANAPRRPAVPVPAYTEVLRKHHRKVLLRNGDDAHASQWTTGIGHPQYRCRLTPQSRRRYWIVRGPSLSLQGDA